MSYAQIIMEGVKFISGQRQAKAEEQSKLSSAEFNLQVAKDEARRTQAAGLAEAERLKRGRHKLTGQQQVGFGVAGVTSEGSPIDLQIRSAQEEELNIQNIKQEFDIKAEQARSQAKLEQFEIDKIKLAQRGRRQFRKKASTFTTGTPLLSFSGRR